MKCVDLNIVALRKYLPGAALILDYNKAEFFFYVGLSYAIVNILYCVHVLCFDAHVKCF